MSPLRRSSLLRLETLEDRSVPAATVSITPIGRLDPTFGSLKFAINFSEPVTGFSVLDVQITATTRGGPIKSVSGSGANYTLEVKFVLGSGSFTVTVPDGAALDGMGNPTTGGSLSTYVRASDPGLKALEAGASGGVVQEYTFTGLDPRSSVVELGGFTPFPGFTGIVRAITTDVDGDSNPDYIYVTGPGGGDLVRIISGAFGNPDLLAGTFAHAYPGENFTNIGLFVAAGDVDGDDNAEIVVSPDQGGGARVQVFKLANGVLNQTANFFSIDDPAFRGGGRIAMGDFNGDGIPDLLAGAGFGGGPRIAVYDGRDLVGGVKTPRKLVNDFLIFEPGLRDGVFVGAGDLDGDGKAEMIFGGGPGGGPRVQVLRFSQVLANVEEAKVDSYANFFAFDSNQRGGVRVTAKDLNGDGLLELVAASGDGAAPGVKLFQGTSLSSSPTVVQLLFPFSDPTLANGVFVG